MASHSQKTKRRRARHHTNEGRRRKAKESKQSTPSYQELFAKCGEPGQPVTK